MLNVLSKFGLEKLGLNRERIVQILHSLSDDQLRQGRQMIRDEMERRGLVKSGRRADKDGSQQTQDQQ